MIDKIDMSKQEMFDKSVGGLIEQGCRGVNSGGNCVYRSPEGNKCAFGQCIPDDRYTTRMEGYSLSTVLDAKECEDYNVPLDKNCEFYRAFKDNFTLNVLKFGQQLQDIHDETSDFEEMLEKYKDFALENNLSLEVFNNA